MRFCDMFALLALSVAIFSVVPEISAGALRMPSVSNSSIQPISRESQRPNIVTSPYQWFADYIREIFGIFREYSSGILPNVTIAAYVPSTNVLQHVTLSNIRNTLSSFANSDAAPVLAGLVSNFDRDTFQFFSSPERTASPLLLGLRTAATTNNPTTTTNSGVLKFKTNSITAQIKNNSAAFIEKATAITNSSDTLMTTATYKFKNYTTPTVVSVGTETSSRVDTSTEMVNDLKTESVVGTDLIVEDDDDDDSKRLIRQSLNE